MEAGRRLSDLPALVSGHERRRRRRSRGHPPTARLSELARRRCDLDFPDLSIADGRLRLRHFRLLRHRSAVRVAGRFRPAVAAKRIAAASRSFSISSPITRRISIPGSRRADRRAPTPSAIGTSGAMPKPTVGRRTIGCRNSAGRPGPSIRRRRNTICTASCASSPISIGAIRRCATPCSRPCGSGSIAASTVFAST